MDEIYYKLLIVMSVLSVTLIIGIGLNECIAQPLFRILEENKGNESQKYIEKNSNVKNVEINDEVQLENVRLSEEVDKLKETVNILEAKNVHLEYMFDMMLYSLIVAIIFLIILMVILAYTNFFYKKPSGAPIKFR